MLILTCKESDKIIISGKFHFHVKLLRKTFSKTIFMFRAFPCDKHFYLVVLKPQTGIKWNEKEKKKKKKRKKRKKLLLVDLVLRLRAVNKIVSLIINISWGIDFLVKFFTYFPLFSRAPQGRKNIKSAAISNKSGVFYQRQEPLRVRAFT